MNDILRARYGHEKEYHVTVNATISPDFIEKMASGVAIGHGDHGSGGHGQAILRHLKQGLNRQIRRMSKSWATGPTEARAHHERRTRRFARRYLPALGRFGNAQTARTHPGSQVLTFGSLMLPQPSDLAGRTLAAMSATTRPMPSPFSKSMKTMAKMVTTKGMNTAMPLSNIFLNVAGLANL